MLKPVPCVLGKTIIPLRPQVIRRSEPASATQGVENDDGLPAGERDLHEPRPLLERQPFAVW